MDFLVLYITARTFKAVGGFCGLKCHEAIDRRNVNKVCNAAQPEHPQMREYSVMHNAMKTARKFHPIKCK